MADYRAHFHAKFSENNTCIFPHNHFKILILQNYPLILLQDSNIYKLCEIIHKFVILSIALARPGNIFPVVGDITHIKKLKFYSKSIPR